MPVQSKFQTCPRRKQQAKMQVARQAGAGRATRLRFLRLLEIMHRLCT